MSRSLLTIFLLTCSNIFMTLAWYGHLKLAEWTWFQRLGIFSIILFSWGIAFFEYCFQVPANKMGYQGNGGPFSLLELKVLQEVLTLLIFVVFSVVFFKSESLRWNHAIGLFFLVLSVYFVFKK